MRVVLLAAAGMLATTAACGGVDRTTSNSTGPATCGHGPNLVQTSSSVILGSADVAMTVEGRFGFFELSAPVATSDGKTILATWTAADTSGGFQGHVVVARLGPGGVVGTSAPIDAPVLGVAAFDGTDFLVVGSAGGPPAAPSTPSSLLLEHVGLDGSAVAAAQPIETIVGRGSVTSAVWTPRGLAVAWRAQGPSAAPQTAVQLFDPDGLLIRGMVPPDAFVTDPNTGLRAFAAAAVALFQGQLVVANGHDVSTLDWLGGSAQTSKMEFTVSVPEKGGFPTIFETGGQLRMWGSGGVSPESDSSWYEDVFSGAPGESFSQIGVVDESAITQAPDGCGGAVTLSNRGTALGVVSDTAPQRIVSLGTTVPDVFGVAAMTATPTGFVVVWVGADGMHLSTLAWR